MELAARVEALEEELKLLKGEIKSILQEVRGALLDRDNPFSSSYDQARTRDAAAPIAAPVAPAPAVEAPVAIEAPKTQEAPVTAALAPRALERAEEPPARQRSEQQRGDQNGQQRRRAPRLTQIEEDDGQRERPYVGVHVLAALMSWTQEFAGAYTVADLKTILALARYGGLIDVDLERTLNRVGEGFGKGETLKPATTTDRILALRQLEAVVSARDDEQRLGRVA